MEKDKLTKADIVEGIFIKMEGELDRDVIRSVVDYFFEEIKSGLERNQVIELRGFGTFEIKKRKAKEKARNPKTGDAVSVNTHGVAAFRAGRELKKQVWNLD